MPCLIKSTTASGHNLDPMKCIYHQANNKTILSFRGEDFRKVYLKLSSLQAYFPDVNFIAMTGTGLKKMVDSIKENLALERCTIVTTSPNRGNIFLKKTI